MGTLRFSRFNGLTYRDIVALIEPWLVKDREFPKDCPSSHEYLCQVVPDDVAGCCRANPDEQFSDEECAEHWNRVFTPRTQEQLDILDAAYAATHHGLLPQSADGYTYRELASSIYGKAFTFNNHICLEPCFRDNNFNCDESLTCDACADQVFHWKEPIVMDEDDIHDLEDAYSYDDDEACYEVNVYYECRNCGEMWSIKTQGQPRFCPGCGKRIKVGD